MGLFDNLDEDAKARIQQFINEADARGVPVDKINEYIQQNADSFIDNATGQSVLKAAEDVSDPAGKLTGFGLSLIEPNAMNLIALPASFYTGGIGGKLLPAITKFAGSKAIARLAVRFAADGGKGSTYLFDAALKEGLETSYGALIRIAEEPSFIASLGRAVGMAIPFSTAEAIDAVEDDRSPVGAFAGTLSVFTALDLLLTQAVPGVGHVIGKKLRRRIASEFFYEEAALRGVFPPEVREKIRQSIIPEMDAAALEVFERVKANVPEEHHRALALVLNSRTIKFAGSDEASAAIRKAFHIDIASERAKIKAEAEKQAKLQAELAEKARLRQLETDRKKLDLMKGLLGSVERAKTRRLQAESDLEAALRTPRAPAALRESSVAAASATRERAELLTSQQKREAVIRASLRKSEPENVSPPDWLILNSMSDAEIEAYLMEDLIDRTSGSRGLTDFVNSVRRAHDSLKRDSPQAASAVEQAAAMVEQSGAVPDNPTTRTVLSALKGETVDDAGVVSNLTTAEKAAAGETVSAARPNASALEAAAEATPGVAAPVDDIDALKIRLDKLTTPEEQLAELAAFEKTVPPGNNRERAYIHVRRKAIKESVKAPVKVTKDTADILEAEARGVSRDEIPIDLDEVEQGQAVTAIVNGQRVEAAIEDVTDDGRVLISLATGKRILVPDTDVFPIAGPKASASPSAEAVAEYTADVAFNDAKDYEASLINKYRSELQHKQTVRYDPKMRANFTPKTQGRFPEGPVLGRIVRPRSNQFFGRSRTLLKKGEDLFIGREGMGLGRGGGGGGVLTHKAFIYRMDPETNLPHYVGTVSGVDFDREGLKFFDQPFGGTVEAASDAVRAVLERQRGEAARLKALDYVKLFVGGKTVPDKEAAKDLLTSLKQPEDGDFPFMIRSLLDRMAAIRERQAIKAAETSPSATVSKLEDVGNMADRLLSESNAAAITPEQAAINRAEAEEFHRLASHEEGLTPFKRDLLNQLRSSKKLTPHMKAQKAFLESIQNVSFTVKQAKRLRELERKFGTAEEHNKRAAEKMEERVRSITFEHSEDLAIQRAQEEAAATGIPSSPPTPAISPEVLAETEEAGVSKVVSGGIDGIENAWRRIGKTKVARFDWVDPERPEFSPVADFLDKMYNYLSVRNMKMNVEWAPEPPGSEPATTMFGKLVFEYDGTYITEFEPAQMKDALNWLRTLDLDDPQLIKKIKRTTSHSGRKPGSGS